MWGALFPFGKSYSNKVKLHKISRQRNIQSPRQPATEELGILTRMMTSRHRFVNEFSQFNLVLLCKASLTTLPLLSNCYNVSSPMKEQIMERSSLKPAAPRGRAKGCLSPGQFPIHFVFKRTNTGNRIQTLLAGTTHKSTGCNTSLLMI